MFYADQLGLHEVVRDLKRIARTSSAAADFWQPAGLLRRLAAEGQSFSQHTGGVA
jgi:3-hydroxyacyl-CoA dehydrogenase